MHVYIYSIKTNLQSELHCKSVTLTPRNEHRRYPGLTHSQLLTDKSGIDNSIID